MTPAPLSDTIENGYRVARGQGAKHITLDFYDGNGCCALGFAWVGLLSPNGERPYTELFAYEEGEERDGAGLHLPEAYESGREELELNDHLPYDQLPFDLLSTFSDWTLEHSSSFPLMAAISTLNDELGWSIDEIVSWLRSIGR